MKKVAIVILVVAMIVLSSFHTSQTFPCHSLGDLYPCEHPMHSLGDLGPCQHTYWDNWGNLRAVHAGGDIYPCSHALHSAGDLGPCTHICW